MCCFQEVVSTEKDRNLYIHVAWGWTLYNDAQTIYSVHVSTQMGTDWIQQSKLDTTAEIKHTRRMNTYPQI